MRPAGEKRRRGNGSTDDADQTKVELSKIEPEPEPKPPPAELPTAEESPDDVLQRLEPMELERFCRLEAEMRVCIQGLKLLDFELTDLKRNYQAKITSTDHHRKLLRAELNGKLRPQYDAMILDLAKKYGITEPSRMLVDTDAGTIRDSGELGS